jgi:hypothetical protein
MRTTAVLAALLIGAPALGGAATLPPPLGPAAAGELQCYVPNLAKKTCQLIAAYARGEAGTIQNVATAMVSADPFIVMTTIAPMQVRDGRVCGAVRAEDFATATFTIGGRPATPGSPGPFSTARLRSTATRPSSGSPAARATPSARDARRSGVLAFTPALP